MLVRVPLLVPAESSALPSPLYWWTSPDREGVLTAGTKPASIAGQPGRRAMVGTGPPL